MRVKFKEFGALRFFHLECGTWVRLCVPLNLMTITIYKTCIMQKASASQLLQGVQHGNTKPQAMPNSLRNHILSLFIDVCMKMLRESDLNAGSISVSSLWWAGCGSSRLWWVRWYQRAKKIRRKESNAKCRYLKKFTCKGTLRQVFICLRLSPLLDFCLGWSSNFVGSESGQIKGREHYPPPCSRHLGQVV